MRIEIGLCELLDLEKIGYNVGDRRASISCELYTTQT